MRAKVLVMAVVISLAWCLSSLGSAQAQQGQSIDPELQKFQGAWVMTSAEMDGKTVAEEHVKLSKITFVGNKVELIAPHQHKDTIYATIVKVTPMEMQWVRSSGPNAGTTMNAIFEFDGPDQYKICFDPAGGTVPKEFGTKAGSGHIWQTWKRIKP